MKKEPTGEFIRGCTFRTRRFRACGGITTGDFCCRKQQLRLVRDFCRQIVGRLHQPVFQLLFRRVRQQLYRSWSHRPVSRLLQFPGRRTSMPSAPASFGKMLGEYNLPPKRFRRDSGATWMYVNWARADAVLFRPVHQFHQRAQPGHFAIWVRNWISASCMFTYLNTTLSGGYAAAADHNGHISTQYMVSLRIL